jgi:hypothetical protein
MAFISFKTQSGAKTALLLDGAELGPLNISVKMSTASALQTDHPLHATASPSTTYSQGTDLTSQRHNDNNDGINKNSGEGSTTYEHYQARLPKSFDEAVQPAKRDLKSWWRDFRTKQNSEMSNAQRLTLRRDAVPSPQPVPSMTVNDKSLDPEGIYLIPLSGKPVLTEDSSPDIWCSSRHVYQE